MNNSKPLLLLLLIIFCLQASAQTDYKRKITQMDSLLFEEAFNKCKIDILHQIVDDDFEMYHDQSGSTFGKSNFINGIQNNICSLEYRPFRKLINDEKQVLKSNGEIYAVLQTGSHEFYAKEKDREAYLTSTANFTHLWLKDQENFVLKRVFSYNHESSEKSTSNGSKEFINECLNYDGLLHNTQTPALGVAILKQGKLQQIIVNGELEKGLIAPYNTIFNVASLTKPVVTILTLRLIQNGNWNLDEPLWPYWIDPDVKDDINSKKLTTRHILSHQSGFKNWRHDNESGLLEFDFEPGNGYRYSGEGFEYLKKALESKFKTSLDILADSLIFKPLKMTDTYFYWTKEVDENRFAKWHDQQGNNSYKTYKNTSASAADDLLTTIEDYGRFAEFVLNGAGLSEELFNEMTSRQNGSKHNVFMGLGWEILPELKKEEFAILHTGGDIGVNTLIILLPKTKEGLVIFTNGDNGKNLYFDIIENSLSLGRKIVGKD